MSRKNPGQLNWYSGYFLSSPLRQHNGDGILLVALPDRPGGFHLLRQLWQLWLHFAFASFGVGYETKPPDRCRSGMRLWEGQRGRNKPPRCS